MARSAMLDDRATPWLSGRDDLMAPTDPAGQLEAPQASAAPNESPWMTEAHQAPAPQAQPQQPPAAAGDYTQALGPTAMTQPTPQAQTAATPQPQAAGNYAALLNDVQSAADPGTQSVARDTLARTVQQDLEADGHKVTWKGDQMVVDGRPYELGGAPAPQTAALQREEFSTQPADVAPGPTANTAPGGVVSNPQNAFGRGVPAEQYVRDAIAAFGFKARQSEPQSLQPLVDALRTEGYNATIAAPSSGGYVKGIMLDGHFVKLLDGSDNWMWGMDANLQPSGGGAAPPTPTSPTLPASPWAGTPGEIPPWLQNPQADPTLTDLAGTIPGYEDVYKTLSASNPTEQGTSDLVNNILAHPESLSDRDVETLKAKNAEELASASQLQDEELQHFGASAGAGLMDSPWLAGQRASNSWNRRAATVDSNRNVDIGAAKTRQDDRLSSAKLGADWSAYKQNKSTAAINAAIDAVGAKGNLVKAAKDLGMTKSQLLLNYIGQNLDYDISLKTLQQKGDQFAQELAQRIAELRQHSDEFAANFGLNLNQFQLDKDRFAWDKAKSTFAP